VAALVLGVGAVVAEADPVPSPGSAQAPASSSSTRSTERAPQPAAREACEDDEVDHQDMDASVRRWRQWYDAARPRIRRRRRTDGESQPGVLQPGMPTSNRAQNNVGVFGSMPRSAS
jgi:hypothetical protein